MPLSKREQETIINFNKEEKMAYIYTHEKTWQQHLEKKLHLKPTSVDSYDGRCYEIDKLRIKMPRAPKKLSKVQRKVLGERLSAIRSPKITTAQAKTKDKGVK